MVTRFVLAAIVLALCLPIAQADDRSRRAKVALALSATPAATATVAPMPREKQQRKMLNSYGDGYALAKRDRLPLVVYVGYDGPAVEGAVTARVESFSGVEAPAVLVVYPDATGLRIDHTLSGNTATPDAIRAAVLVAAKKIDAKGPDSPPLPAAPKPLDWQIRTGIVAYPTATPVCLPGQA
jgi:hypothetical protein